MFHAVLEQLHRLKKEAQTDLQASTMTEYVTLVEVSNESELACAHALDIQSYFDDETM